LGLALVSPCSTMARTIPSYFDLKKSGVARRSDGL
jgi:hypothetical protein